MLRVIERVKKHLEQGAKIVQYEHEKSPTELTINYCITLSDKSVFAWTLAPMIQCEEYKETEKVLSDESNYNIEGDEHHNPSLPKYTPPPPPKKEILSKVKEQIGKLKEDLADNRKVEDWELGEEKDIYWYNITLTGDLVHAVGVWKTDNEGVEYVEQFIKDNYKPTACNLTNGDFVEPQKDAPFYQGMTKEEAIVSLAKNVYGYSCNAAYFLTIYNVFIHGTKLIVEPLASGGRSAYFYDKEKRAWEAQSPTEKKEQEGKAVFEEHKKMIDTSKDGILATVYFFEPPELTPQDLIQAAKDELVGRVSGQYRCSPRTRKQESKLNAGWAACIQYLEFLTGTQEKPKNVK